MSYVLVSDIHAHKWSLFSKPTKLGVNGRLQIILDELERAACYAVSKGSNLMVIAGDIMHVRGSIDPHVLNPLQETVRDILNKGIDIIAIPGNHDLADKETTTLGNAIKTLADTKSDYGSFTVVDKPRVIDCLALFPWYSKPDDLLAEMKVFADQGDVSQLDAIVHVGIDGVLPNMSGHGLDPKTLADLGYRNVFAGHYHHHKSFDGNVWSIGATTHQTYGDINSKAGFLFVTDDGSVTYNASRAPRFVDVTGLDEDDMALAADGNYVRFSGKDMTPADIADLRKFFENAGAKGVSILATQKSAASRRPGAAKTAQTLDDSVGSYIDDSKDIPAFIDKAQLKNDCADVLSRARSVHEEA